MTASAPVALVTGAGRRIGQAIAVALGARGMRVAVHHNQSGADETCRLIRDRGGEPVPFAANLAEPEAPDALVAAVVAHFGTLDLLVNSAAVMERTPIGEVTPAQWDAMFALNLRAPFFLAQAASRAMGERGGTIVNMADLAAFETWPAYIPHGITKAGIVQMTRALARALGPRVRVNAVAPGAVLLPEAWNDQTASHLRSTTPLQRLGSPDDVVQAVLFLVDAAYVTGETIVVDGGRHVRT